MILTVCPRIEIIYTENKKIISYSLQDLYRYKTEMTISIWIIQLPRKLR